MTPEQIAQALKNRDWGWSPSIVSEHEVDDLIDVELGDLMKCVDGRPSDNVGMAGPKTLGGVYAIASLRGVTTLDGLKEVVQEVLDAGYTPSIHGDDHADPSPMGCGYFKLWSTGKLTGLDKPGFDANAGAQAVLSVGGAYERLEGSHAEKEVVINLVPGKTLAPSHPQRFVVDAWVAGEFELDAGKYLTLAAQTVELLTDKPGKRVTKVRIVAPSAPLS